MNTQEYPGTIGAPYIQYMTTDYLTATPPIMHEGYFIIYFTLSDIWYTICSYSEKAIYMPFTYFANSYRKHFKDIKPVTEQVKDKGSFASACNVFVGGSWALPR